MIVFDDPQVPGEGRDEVFSCPNHTQAILLCEVTSAQCADGDSVFIHKPEGSFHWREVCHEPVWLSLAEAQAYAQFRGCRIMSESEYHCILADPAASNR